MKHPELILFAKQPVPGRTKTRLAPTYNALEAAEIADFLIRSTVELAVGSWPDRVSLYVDPDPVHPLFEELAEIHGIALCTQAAGDLGKKMSVALAEGFARGGAAAIMGCDVPHCYWDTLDDAHLFLTQGKNVLGQTEDGGYYLIGLSRVAEGLFTHVEWGGKSVFNVTYARARDLNIDFELLPTLRDIDTADDLQAVAQVFEPLRRYLK